MNKDDIKHLDWVYLRMKHVHGEDENLDYMIKFKKILDKLNQPIKQVNSGELFEVEGRKYIIKTNDSADQESSFDNGQRIFNLKEI